RPLAAGAGLADAIYVYIHISSPTLTPPHGQKPVSTPDEDAMSDLARPPSSLRRGLAASVLPLLIAACAASYQPPPSATSPVTATQQRPLGALLQAAAYPNSSTLIVQVTMQQLAATHREWQGYDYFGRLAAEQPQRRVLFRAMQAVL